MDLLQDQVTTLSDKIDALHQVVDQLAVKISLVISEEGMPVESSLTRVRSSFHGNRSYYPGYNGFNTAMEHKDILEDADCMETSNSQSGERKLAPEVQIQRLTAQLTAAYNRIAALEEQLLAQRIH